MNSQLDQSTALFNRSAAIKTIMAFVGNQPADPERYEAWLHSLTDEQLQHFSESISES